MIENKQPELILLDVKMPIMDGMEVLKRCKKVDENLPIVVMTGYAGIEGAVEAIKQASLIW
ncbi:MAG: response regulator [Pseudomonadota bacterium]